MNYIEKLACLIQKESDCLDADRTRLLPLYRLYALLALSKGVSTTAEDVHNAWVVWASAEQPESEYLIPFCKLSAEVQARDEPYAARIRAIAVDLKLEEL